MLGEMNRAGLLERWQALWKRLGLAPPQGLVKQLLNAYGEPHRAYHTGEHLAECFAHLDACPDAPFDGPALELALWFHDAVYDTRAADNERRSALWARSALSVLPVGTLDRVEALILVTRHDAEPADLHQRWMLDVDLAILGAEPARFDVYEAQIRHEYSWVPEAAYRAARAQILQGFMSRPTLYHTAHFQRLLEAQARENLGRSIAALSG